MAKEHEIQKKRLRKELTTLIEAFGNMIIEADPAGYKGLIHIDAVDLYIVKKYGWFPKDVRKMSIEDKSFLLNEELGKWTIK